MPPKCPLLRQRGGRSCINRLVSSVLACFYRFGGVSARWGPLGDWHRARCGGFWFRFRVGLGRRFCVSEIIVPCGSVGLLCFGRIFVSRVRQFLVHLFATTFVAHFRDILVSQFCDVLVMFPGALFGPIFVFRFGDISVSKIWWIFDDVFVCHFGHILVCQFCDILDQLFVSLFGAAFVSRFGHISVSKI